MYIPTFVAEAVEFGGYGQARRPQNADRGAVGAEGAFDAKLDLAAWPTVDRVTSAAWDLEGQGVASSSERMPRRDAMMPAAHCSVERPTF